MSGPASTNSEQRTLHYSGHVQGVGFRFTTHSIARRLPVAGYVLNLPDGRVKLVAEGPASDLDTLERQVADQMADHIHNTQRDVRPATGQFAQFEIRH